MKIAIIGYGKMGKAIEEIVIARNHTISFRISSVNASDLNKINASNTDVAIEFSNPHVAYHNIRYCITRKIPVISGTTGWLNQKEELESLCQNNDSAFLYASNFSIGVNLFFAINTYAAKILSKFPEYKLHIQEIHHTQKKDAPSGTAISLANDIIAQNVNYNDWKLTDKAEKADNVLPIFAVRQSGVPGTHTICYDYEVDRIELIHTAHNRVGFASGAVTAAEWIQNKKGIFSMKDVLKITT